MEGKVRDAVSTVLRVHVQFNAHQAKERNAIATCLVVLYVGVTDPGSNFLFTIVVKRGGVVSVKRRLTQWFILISLTFAAVTFIALWLLKQRTTIIFVDLKDPQQIRHLLEQHVPLRLETSISDDQKSKLYDTLSQLLFIYKEGSFDSFIRYLSDRRGIVNPQNIKVMRDLPVFTHRIETLPPDIRTKVTRVATQVRTWPPKEDMETFRAFWLLLYSETGTFKAIAPEVGYIRIFQTNQPINANTAMSIMQRSSIYPTNRSSLVFNRETLFPGENERPCLYAEVYLPAEHPTNDPPWGYYFWLRWSKVISNWFLDLAGMDFSGERDESSDILY
ncbi:hypothetical protein B0813_000130 [Candidatus Fervidibacteria bacterium JGI MDM2 SSWTFF-3-K9]